MNDKKSTPLGTRPSEGAWPPRRISGAGLAAKSTWVEVPDRNGGPAAWCYSDKRGYGPGETVCLYISSTVEALDLDVVKEGARPTLFKQFRNQAVAFQGVGESTYRDGCNWRETVSFELPANVEPGAYRIEMRRPHASAKDQALGHHIFFVRAAKADPEALLLVASTCTWSAYNDWGGASHYRGIHPNYPQGACPILSANRPWARGQVWLPDGAPRNVPTERPRTPAPARNESKDWAFANGFTRYFGSTGWPTYERPFLLWAERNGYKVHVIAQDDLELNPDCVKGYRCVVFMGHDEYWSRPMRDTIDAFVEAGGRVARFAGNFLWQIRLDTGGGGQTCYKYLARERDPLRDSNPVLMSGAWEDPRINHPGAKTFGVNALRGIYAGLYAMAPRSPRGFNVFRQDHWSLDKTGLGYADMFGDEASIFAFEVDGLEYTFEGGQPVPTGVDGAPEGLEIIAMGWATQAEHGLPEHSYSHFLGDADARFAASVLDESDSQDAISRRSRGSGMMVSFRKGKGEVFCAGTCEWVRGLIENEFYTQQITRNVFDRFLTPPSGH